MEYLLHGSGTGTGNPAFFTLLGYLPFAKQNLDVFKNEKPLILR
jgi:hypothetical protein